MHGTYYFDHDHLRALRKAGDVGKCIGYFEAHSFLLDTRGLIQQTGRDSYIYHKDAGSKNL